MPEQPPQNTEPPTPDAAERSREAKWMTRGIAGALIVWGTLLGIGATMGIAEQTPGGDPRKLLVVAGTTGLFLMLWGGVLLAAKRRKPRRRAVPAPSTDESNPG
ncbi:MAG: hypothetical protein AAGA92_01125 [Planctomycetota bacterium]